MFNVSIEKFSYRTGRSLTTFKRYFKKAFHTTPQKISYQEKAGTGALPAIGKDGNPV